MTRSRHIPLLALAGTLALTGLATAQSRPQPPASAYLSPTERVCEALGTFALARANDRDGGIPMLRILALSRQYDAEHGASAWATRMHDTIIQGLYAEPSLTPRRAQTATEVGCIDGLTKPK